MTSIQHTERRSGKRVNCKSQDDDESGEDLHFVEWKESFGKTERMRFELDARKTTGTAGDCWRIRSSTTAYLYVFAYGDAWIARSRNVL